MVYSSPKSTESATETATSSTKVCADATLSTSQMAHTLKLAGSDSHGASV
jgi:hypothetical protein